MENRKVVTGITLTLLLMGALGLVFDVGLAGAGGTIYIRADGSIDPPTAPISTTDNVTYTLTGNITIDVANAAGIAIERNDIVVDGAGYTLQCMNAPLYAKTGIGLGSRINVTIRNVVIRGFTHGIFLTNSIRNQISNNTIMKNTIYGWPIHVVNSNSNNISNNIIRDNPDGIMFIEGSNYNIVANNSVYNINGYGIEVYYSNGNKIINNIVMNTRYTGIRVGGTWYVYGSSNNIIANNNVSNNVGAGISIDAKYGGISRNNTVFGNNLVGNTYTGISLGKGASENKIIANNIKNNNDKGIYIEDSTNVIYHNNIIDNAVQAYVKAGYTDVWDNGYPSAGNYWSNYTGTDLYSGPDQNISGSDGIGDSPHVLDANNRDRYPFMAPYVWVHDIAVTSIMPSETVVYQSDSLYIDVNVTNEGDYTETFNVTVYANVTPIETQTVTDLLVGAMQTLTFSWDTTSFACGNYTIKATASVVPGDTNTTNNIRIDGIVTILPIPYDVTIRAYCYTESAYVSVSITVDGTPTGYTTPHTFTDLTGTHTFTVPSTDANSHPFKQWSTGNTSTTVTVSTGGTYTAYYQSDVHDVAVTNIVPSKPVVGQGYSLNINVTAANQGDYTETFNVTVYANTTAIATQTITLTSLNSTTITFTWNTTGFAKGNYTIWAYAWPVPGETHTQDNTCLDSIVTVTIPGDVDGDHQVTILDVVKITSIYATKLGDPRFRPNSDIDNDGRITILDVVICTSHYAQKDP